jgi:hypothetical protein
MGGIMLDIRVMTEQDSAAAFEIVDPMNWGYL